MSLDTSKLILKIVGILGIISGVGTLIMGVISLLAGGILTGLASEVDGELGGAVGAFALIGIIAIIVIGVVTLLEGIFSVRASNDPSKVMPAWIFAIIGLIGAIIGVVSNLSGGMSALVTPIVTLVENGCIFMAANTIKNANENGGEF